MELKAVEQEVCVCVGGNSRAWRLIKQVKKTCCICFMLTTNDCK
jgi:hypothetical protein